MVLMERHSPGEIFKSPLSAKEVFSCIEAYVEDVHGGVNEDGVRQYKSTTNQEVTIVDAILIYLYQYERYLRSSGGAWSRASGYLLHVQSKNGQNVFQSARDSI